MRKDWQMARKKKHWKYSKHSVHLNGYWFFGCAFSGTLFQTLSWFCMNVLWFSVYTAECELLVSSTHIWTFRHWWPYSQPLFDFVSFFSQSPAVCEVKRLAHCFILILLNLFLRFLLSSVSCQVVLNRNITCRVLWQCEAELLAWNDLCDLYRSDRSSSLWCEFMLLPSGHRCIMMWIKHSSYSCCHQLCKDQCTSVFLCAAVAPTWY